MKVPPQKRTPNFIFGILIAGEKLAKIELTLMTTIKSLRAKQKEDEKITSSALSRAEKADRQLAETRTQLKRGQDVERKNTERLRGMYKIESANETLRREQEVAQATIGSLRGELAEANARADEAVAQIQTEALEEERRVGGELREKLERLQTEMSMVQEQSRSEIQELKGRLDREQASSKSLRAGFTAEISVPPRKSLFVLWGSGVQVLMVDAGIKAGSPSISGRRFLYISHVLCAS
jgi:TATA element modulatory factor